MRPIWGKRSCAAIAAAAAMASSNRPRRNAPSTTQATVTPAAEARPSARALCAPKVSISGTSSPTHKRRLTRNRDSRSFDKNAGFRTGTASFLQSPGAYAPWGVT